MTTSHRSNRLLLTGVASLSALGLTVLAAAPTIATEPPVPPIAVEELTKIGDAFVRGDFTDDMSASFRIGYEGVDPVTVDSPDLSRMAVARITVQPGAQFPWHTHAGPVLVTVTEGELAYVMPDDCTVRSYPAGTSFVDHGHGHVHSAYNPTDGETVVIAVFLEATADGPLTITDGVTAPEGECGGAAPASGDG